MAGNLAQVAGQSWLVLDLTDSAVALGVVSALQFLPVLLLGARAGAFAGERDRRQVLLVANGAAGCIGLLLGLVTLLGVVPVPMVALAACLNGITLAFDSPARSLFALDLVGAEAITNALSVNSVVTSAGRVIGPAVAALLIATVGTGACFVVNGLSYLTLCAVMSTIRARHVRPPATSSRSAWPFATLAELGPPVCWLLGLIAVFGIFVFEFEVTLPLVATQVFDGGAATYGWVSVSFGLGAVVGGLVAAMFGSPSARLLLAISAAVAVLLALAAGAPHLAVELVVLPALGACCVAFLALANSLLLVSTPDQARGTVSGLWSTAVIGAKPFGPLVAGGVSELAGTRVTLALGGGILGATANAARRPLGRLGHMCPTHPQ